MSTIKILAAIGISIIPTVLAAMDTHERFNVGGHKFIIAKNNALLKQSSILQNPSESSFYVGLDNEGFHFFELSSKEGRILEHYLHYGKLKKASSEILKKTGEHFNLKEFPELISRTNTVQLWDFPRCPICRAWTLDSLFERTKHMVERHHATVHGGYFEKREHSYNNYVAIYYSNVEDEPTHTCCPE